jgi:hypothetical protein
MLLTITGCTPRADFSKSRGEKFSNSQAFFVLALEERLHKKKIHQKNDCYLSIHFLSIQALPDILT